MDIVTTGDGARSLGSPVRSFQLVFHEAVTEGLTEVLGSSGARATFFHLRLNVSADANGVHEGLLRMFGDGARCLESSILRNLYARIGSTFSSEESKTFAGHVSAAKRLHARPPVGGRDV